MNLAVLAAFAVAGVLMGVGLLFMLRPGAYWKAAGAGTPRGNPSSVRLLGAALAIFGVVLAVQTAVRL